MIIIYRSLITYQHVGNGGSLIVSFNSVANTSNPGKHEVILSSGVTHKLPRVLFNYRLCYTSYTLLLRLSTRVTGQGVPGPFSGRKNRTARSIRGRSEVVI